MSDSAENPRADRFKTLPPAVKLEDTVEIKDESAVADPEAGRNTDQDFTLRYSG